ncbi:MAG: hypothetical protein P0Y53_24330 [Candidatus Pseudobacter hemicellulosilyticus]|uniref:Uncharacterized protein n=1 Tax=Candidatus Pseudobacter hemicellulosilyticus TaxID=3121375 RepID=A0AAJ5WWF5_9BACT|nr:MAG: hypothetical protein P0Y53_24330 [Pseudobacter sp.]
MKRLLTVLTLLSLLLILTASVQVPVQAATMAPVAAVAANSQASPDAPVPAATVYICKSPSAVAYHSDGDCRGLNRCTHTIVRVSKESAVEYGYRACGYCY